MCFFRRFLRHRHHHHDKRRATKMAITLTANGLAVTFFGDYIMDITTAQKVLAAVSFADAAGLPAVAPGPVVWATDNTDVSLTPSADGLSCEVSGDAVGTATITATSGTLSATGVVNVGAVAVVPGPATSMTMTFGVPVAK